MAFSKQWEVNKQPYPFGHVQIIHQYSFGQGWSQPRPRGTKMAFSKQLEANKQPYPFGNVQIFINIASDRGRASRGPGQVPPENVKKIKTPLLTHRNGKRDRSHPFQPHPIY